MIASMSGSLNIWPKAGIAPSLPFLMRSPTFTCACRISAPRQPRWLRMPLVDALSSGSGLAISRSTAPSALICRTHRQHCAIRDRGRQLAARQWPGDALAAAALALSGADLFGALTSQNVELAGEIADGVMPVWWPVDRLAHSRRWIERGRAKSGGRGKLGLTLGLPTYIGEDVDALRASARANL